LGTGSIASNQTCPHFLCHATVFAIGAGHTLHLLTVAAVAGDDHTGILRFYPVKGLALKAGIQSGFCVAKKVKIDGTASLGPGLTEPFTEDVKLGDAVKDFAFAIPVGVSYEYESFVLDARYNIGVTKAAPIPSAVFCFLINSGICFYVYVLVYYL